MEETNHFNDWETFANDWAKLNSMKSAENRTVKTALGDHVVIKCFYIRHL